MALIHARPESEPGAGPWALKKQRAQMEQWETDVFSVSLALELAGVYDGKHFRAQCQGPKDRGENP